MSYFDDKNLSSVFGNAADGIEFDKVLEADEDDGLIETVMSLDETSDDNADFHETTGENDKDPDDIAEELEGQPDSGDNSHTHALDIDLSVESALIEAQLMESEDDFHETTGENDKDPKDIENELEGQPDSACNKHTGTFDPVNGSDTSLGDYSSVEKDLDNMEDAASRASDKGESLYTDGKLSTEAAEDGVDPEPGYDMDDYDGQEDFSGNEDYDGQEDYDGNEDFDGVAENAGDEALEDVMDSFDDDDEDFDDVDVDFDDLDESATDDADEDGELIDAADEEDGEMTQAEIEALVAAGGDDDILDSL